MNEDDLDIIVQPVEEGGQTCNSCYENFEEKDFFSLACSHAFCINCTRAYLKARVVNGRAFKIPCMEFKCKQRFTAEHIQQFCSKKVVKTFETIKEDIKVGSNKRLKWCPRPDCGKVVRKPGCCRNRSVCKCGQEMCFKCGGVWHTGRCQYEGSLLFKAYQSVAPMARCPKCKIPTEKDGGCAHMSCTRCNADWCWLCRMETTGAAYDHYDSIFGCFGMQDITCDLYFLQLIL